MTGWDKCFRVKQKSSGGRREAENSVNESRRHWREVGIIGADAERLDRSWQRMMVLKCEMREAKEGRT